MSQIKDVAAKAGVSPATVSLVLNNKPGISDETRETVMKAVQELGYTRARKRSAPATKKKVRSVQFVLYKKHGLVVADTPFFTYLLEGVETQARKHGLNLLISYIDERAGVENQLQNIVDTGCDGILLLATEMEECDLQPFLNCGIPLVVVDNAMPTCDVDTIRMNNIQGAFDAVQYLADCGLTEIGHLQSSTTIHNFAERRIGYTKALCERGLTENPAYTLRIGSTAESAYSDMRSALESGQPLPQAFFADNDVIALGALRALREAGKNVPEDIALIGFDDVPMCELSTPTLSTVRVEKKYIGCVAVDRLFERMNSPNHPTAHIEIRTTVIPRGSTQKQL